MKYSPNKLVCLLRNFLYMSRIFYMPTPIITSLRQARYFQNLKIRDSNIYTWPGTAYLEPPAISSSSSFLIFTVKFVTSALLCIKDLRLRIQRVQSSWRTTLFLQVNKHHSKDKPVLITVLCFDSSRLLSSFVWFFKLMIGCTVELAVTIKRSSIELKKFFNLLFSSASTLVS